MDSRLLTSWLQRLPLVVEMDRVKLAGNGQEFIHMESHHISSWTGFE